MQFKCFVSFLKLLDSAYRAHDESLDKSAKKGTDLHAELEKFVKGRMAGTGGLVDDKCTPFIKWTDETLTEMLNDKGYNIARRTVAKYREMLNIPVARLRKEL